VLRQFDIVNGVEMSLVPSWTS